MTAHYEVVESVHWRNALTGQTTSIYGAVPWRTDNEALAWSRVSRGWTVKNPLTGQVGIGRPPCTTYAEACELALRLGAPSSIGIGY